MYPEFNDLDGGEEISFPNEWLDTEIEQVVEGADCFAPFASLNEAENLVVLKLSEQEFTEMLSALYVGAQFTYPEKYLQVVANLLKGVHCPPVLEEQECYEYPSYASFVRYSPMSPFVDPNTIPDGYATQPFLANGVNGNSFPNYQPNDVIVPTDAITFDANWFEDLAGVLPTVEIVVSGAGTVFIKFLTIPLGGLVVVTVDNPPDLIDIITGIVTGAENIIDLNQDLVALPPETAQEIVFEVTTAGTGIHTIYAVFLPILDDSLIPIRFGGGFRGLQLCNFIPEADMGIQNLRFTGCDLEQQNSDGTWSVVTGWENWLNCIPASGGGGSVAANLLARPKNVTLSSDITTTSTSYVTGIPGSFSYTPTKKYQLVWVSALAINSGSNSTFLRPLALQSATPYRGEYLTEGRMNGASENRQIEAWDLFVDLPKVSTSWQLEYKVSAGTGTFTRNRDIEWLILEFDDLSELYVQDIRINGGELQKKIGGVWLNVTDSFAAIISAIQTTANNALAAANSAIATNTAQQIQINAAVAVNNAQNTRITALETWRTSATADISDLELSVSGLNTLVGIAQAGVDNLSAGYAWNWYHDMILAGGGYTRVDGNYFAGTGWVSDADGLIEIVDAVRVVSENQVTHVRVDIVPTQVLASPSIIRFRFGNDMGQLGAVKFAGVNVPVSGWFRVPNHALAYNPRLWIKGEGLIIKLTKVTYLGRGQDIPFD